MYEKKNFTYIMTILESIEKIFGSLTILAKSGAKGKDPEFEMLKI